ncbi:MAG: gamma-glutamyl-gamma-aminobutyrate hydrolase family protein [Rickettsiales bacterium]|nr:gamma-glutamyl-gamma-aminobutyrate hydrolase family protein [Rickettsiales bacterium]
MSAPVIGFTLDHETKPTYSQKPWYAIRENYLTAVSAQGGVPLPLPHEVALVERYLSMIDGLVIIGGDFDIPPALYGDTTVHERVTLKEQRTAFEYAITKQALAARKPILGICGGEQLLGVVLGGTLIQHIPDSIDNALPHEQPNPRDEPGHRIAIKENTLLHHIAGVTQASVNSAHHQAMRTVGAGTVISATAPDGVIEAIEYPEHPFCLGVQWHPEYHVSPLDAAIWRHFLDASANRP